MLHVALIGQWRHYLVSLKLREAMQIATRMYSLAQQHHDFTLLMKVDMALAVTHYYLGDFTHARQEATSCLASGFGIRKSRSLNWRSSMSL